jgi:hypothetical protein
MANSWGELTWGTGNLGQQSNITVPLTSVVGFIHCMERR